MKPIVFPQIHKSANSDGASHSLPLQSVLVRLILVAVVTVVATAATLLLLALFEKANKMRKSFHKEGGKI
jgi:hypothetical protein